MEKIGKPIEKQGQQSQEEKRTRHFFEGVSFGQGQKNIQQDGSSTSRHGEEHHPDGISEPKGRVMEQSEPFISNSSDYNVLVDNTWPDRKTYAVTMASDRQFENPFEIFENPFGIEDLMIFDDRTLRRILSSESFNLTIEDLTQSLYGASQSLVERIEHHLPVERQSFFKEVLLHVTSEDERRTACKRVLDNLFWELVYWKKPEMYDELTEGEEYHPGIFQHLEPYIRDKVVLDGGAGAGRATLECISHGASLVYAVDPSCPLLNVLEEKLANLPNVARTECGSFEQLPLADDCVDISLSCSAFRSESGHGGERGLAELQRVTKPGGKIVIIWPDPHDYDWLARHEFQYVDSHYSKRRVCISDLWRVLYDVHDSSMQVTRLPLTIFSSISDWKFLSPF